MVIAGTSSVPSVTRLQVPVVAGLSVSCIHLSDQTTGTSGRWSQCVLYTPSDQTTGTSGRWSQCVLYTPSDQTTGTSGRWSQCVCILYIYTPGWLFAVHTIWAFPLCCVFHLIRRHVVDRGRHYSRDMRHIETINL